MSRIFISYRRADSHLVAGRMAQFLDGIPRVDDVFLDIDGIFPGDDFVDKIHNTLEKASCCLLLIGPQWNGGSDEDGEPRLFSADDFVRLECQLALASDTRVIPILLDDTPFPKASELPEELQQLQRLNAFNLRTAHFDEDMDNLLDLLFGRKRGRGSRWHHKPLTPFGIIKRMAGGLAATAVLILIVAFVHGLVPSESEWCDNLHCSFKALFGLDEDDNAYGQMWSTFFLVLIIGALLPLLLRRK